jgi:uncharacterized protein YutE (UPF0331/DUF86 family)
VGNLPGSREKYGEVLAETFKELREYLRENVISVSKVTEERPLRELRLPRDAPSRLCFFSLPLELLPIYRERVFPLAEEAGFVPVTADDVVAPGDNVNAKIDSLIDRASVMVVELTSQWTRAEYDMAVARLNNVETGLRKRPLHLIVVVESSEQMPSSAQGHNVIFRDSILNGDSEVFFETLSQALREISESTDVAQSSEPRRLLEAKQYRAAVISAMTLLEVRLSDFVTTHKIALTVDWRRPMSMRALVERAAANNLIDASEQEKIASWIRLRNEAVHTTKSINKAAAVEVVEGVAGLLNKIRL